LTGGAHEFDAVSDDLSIVPAIKAAGGRTASARIPSGKIKNAEAELYYLTLVPAEVRLLVLASRGVLRDHGTPAGGAPCPRHIFGTGTAAPGNGGGS